MAFKLINYLKNPQLVASIQQYFGIKIHYDKHFEELKSDEKNKQDEYACTKADHNKKNYIPACNQEINGCDTKSKEFNGYIKKTEFVEQRRNDVTNNREKIAMVLNNPRYTITNPFWYYLFLFGTELGDEIFYTTFIPFLFWNVDGAIGRRVVLVWAIIMSIGKIV